jgi:hypothetical protein
MSRDRGVPSPVLPLAERDRLARAMATLSDTITGVVCGVEARLDERCPYRTAREQCTFSGACQNQRRRARAAHVECGGDHQLRRDPA